jgi:hypothetical protein
MILHDTAGTASPHHLWYRRCTEHSRRAGEQRPAASPNTWNRCGTWPLDVSAVAEERATPRTGRARDLPAATRQQAHPCRRRPPTFTSAEVPDLRHARAGERRVVGPSPDGARPARRGRPERRPARAPRRGLTPSAHRRGRIKTGPACARFGERGVLGEPCPGGCPPEAAFTTRSIRECDSFGAGQGAAGPDGGRRAAHATASGDRLDTPSRACATRIAIRRGSAPGDGSTRFSEVSRNASTLLTSSLAPRPALARREIRRPQGVAKPINPIWRGLRVPP